MQYPFMTLEDLTKTSYLLEYPAGYSIVDTMSRAEDDDIYGRLWRMVLLMMDDKRFFKRRYFLYYLNTGYTTRG